MPTPVGPKMAASSPTTNRSSPVARSTAWTRVVRSPTYTVSPLTSGVVVRLPKVAPPGTS